MQFLIIANGPFLAAAIIQEAARDKIIVALDGAGHKAAKLGIVPHVLLGDFDSINEESAIHLKQQGVEIIAAHNQDLTDLAKAVHYCDSRGATAIDIICAISGTRMDHTLANIGLLRSTHNTKRPLSLITEGNILFFVKEQKITIIGQLNDYCGLVAAPAGKFTSEGLLYNGKDFQLDWGFSASTSNQLAKTVATVEIKGEVIVIHPPILDSQRSFLKLNYAEQLKLLYSEQQHISANSALS